ncbi:hypothetical protein [Thalassolituus marinus]|jgi:hypothetical protein|nr:hypothetical protein [Thalassolituus marinus]
MKKPDILILLTVVVLLGAAVTSATTEPSRPASLMTMENSIR